MKEKNKKELKQNNTNVESQQEMTDEELNEVAGGIGPQMQVEGSLLSKFSLFRRKGIDTQIVMPSCW